MPHDFALTMEEDPVTPLRPVTTRWLPPAAAEEGAFARPFFVAGGVRQEPWKSGDRVAASPPEETPPVAEAAPDADAWAAVLPADSGRAAPPWADERPEVEEAAQPDRPFPLEAFLIPENTTRLPAGLENDRELQDRIAAEVADALSAMVGRLRADGLDALLTPSARREPVDVVLAAVLSGYLSRRAH